MATRTALAITLTAAVLLTQASCSQIECGEGTTETNGECVPADGERPQNDDCGIGTHYDDSEGGCVPDFPPTVCGRNTQPVTNEDGVIECEGIGGGCGPLSCGNPAAGKVSLCGRLYDVENDQPIGDGADGTPCVGSTGGGTATGGPCDLDIKFYPALDFAGDPLGTPPLLPGSFKWTNCGYFAAENIDEPDLGFMGIGVEDGGAADTYVLAGVALPAVAGDRREGLVVYAVRRDTDSAWSAASGLTAPTFNARGAYVPIFLHGEGAPDSADPADPVAGVVVTESGSAESNNTYYFLDTDPHTRSSLGEVANLAGPDFTGPNGSAVKISSSLTNHSGTGSEPDGCKWPSDLAASIMGVTFVQRRVAEVLGTEDPCP